eukprot:scaffold241038_cov42-Prasinocladus_malaysianus.AAC.2
MVKHHVYVTNLEVDEIGCRASGAEPCSLLMAGASHDEVELVRDCHLIQPRSLTSRESTRIMVSPRRRSLQVTGRPACNSGRGPAGDFEISTCLAIRNGDPPQCCGKPE